MRKIVALGMVLVLVCLLCACMPQKAILGTWKHTTTVLGVESLTVYKFNEDGTGSKTNVLTADFVYEFEDDKLHITTKVLGVESTEIYTYEFKGDAVYLTNDKETLRLEKVK